MVSIRSNKASDAQSENIMLHGRSGGGGGGVEAGGLRERGERDGRG